MCGETLIPRDMCVGKRDPRGNTYHCDSGYFSKENDLASHFMVVQAAGTKIKTLYLVTKLSDEFRFFFIGKL